MEVRCMYRIKFEYIVVLIYRGIFRIFLKIKGLLGFIWVKNDKIRYS